MDKVLNDHLVKIIESTDFSRCFSKLREYGMEKNREGIFGVVKNLNSDDYLFTPNLILGKEHQVSRVLGIEYARDKLKAKYENKSVHYLAKSEEFIKESEDQGIPFEVALNEVSKKHNWKNVFNKADYGLPNEFIPYFHIHNHKNSLDILFPSHNDLKVGFSVATLTEENPFYSMIVRNQKGSLFPFLLMKFNPSVAHNIDEVEKEYPGIISSMKYDWEMKFGTQQQRLLNALFHGQPEKFDDLSWEYFVYDSEKRKIK
jgi:hypothetical protein